jgi:hypothetical protein
MAKFDPGRLADDLAAARDRAAAPPPPRSPPAPRPPRLTAPPPPVAVGARTAREAADCPLCDQGIRPGQRIANRPGREAAAAHVACLVRDG